MKRYFTHEFLFGINTYFILQYKSQLESFEKEVSTLRHQKELLQEYHQKQKNKADNLEAQKKSLQASLSDLTENEVCANISYFYCLHFCYN